METINPFEQAARADKVNRIVNTAHRVIRESVAERCAEDDTLDPRAELVATLGQRTGLLARRPTARRSLLAEAHIAAASPTTWAQVIERLTADRDALAAFPTADQIMARL